MGCAPQFVRFGTWCRTVLLMVLLGAGCCAAVEPPLQQRNMLLLYAYGYGGRGVEVFSEGFFRSLTEAGFPAGNVYAEYLDLQRNRDVPDYRRDLSEILRKKYAQRQIDLIVTLQQPALDFLLSEGRDLAPDAPVITIQQRPLNEREKSGRRIVGEVNQFDIRGTLERALELFPQTQRVVFVSGSSEADTKLSEQAAQVAEAWRSKLQFEYTTGMALDDILQRTASLPPHSIIIFTQYNVDTRGHVALAYEVERMIIKAANAPVFGFYDFNLRNGGIGGSVIPVEAAGERTGRLAIEILRGVPLVSAGTLQTKESLPMFDWQQIEHWGGDASRLPANTVFLNRPPSVWQQYGGVISGVLLFVFAQSVLIAILLVNIRRRRRAEQVLGKSEAEFHAIFDGILDSVVFADTERRIRLVNPAFTRMFGYTLDEVAGRSTELLYADPADFVEQGRRRFNPDAETATRIYQMRYRRKDGSEFWAESGGTRIFGSDGQIIGLMGMHRDITERLEAEKTYRSLYDNMLNSVVHCRVIFDEGTPVDYEYLSVNPAFAEVTGIRENVVGRRISEVIPGYCEKNQESLATFGRVASSGVATHWEHYLELLDRWFSFYIYSPVPGEVVIISENITARKQAEEALRQSEERLRLALGATSDGLWDWDIKSGYVYRSPRYFELVGCQPDDSLSNFEFFRSIVHPDDLARVLGTIDAHRQGKTPFIEFDFRLAGGAGDTKWMGVRGRAVDRDADGSARRIVGTLMDITGRKEIESALQARESMLHEAQQLAGLGNWSWHIASGQHYWSEEIYRIYGRDPSLPPATYPEVCTYFTEESWARLAQAVEVALTQGTPYLCDAEVVCPDGSRRWITARGAAACDSNGSVVELHGTVQDITERVQAAEALRQLNTLLEIRVKARTQELSATNEELDSFAYAVSHDLRAPLRAMNGFSQALLEDFSDRLPGDAKAYLDQIGIASRKMGELIEGILALSRGTRGELRLETVDLTEVALRVLGGLARDDPGRQVKIDVTQGMTVIGDARMIEALMQNLLGNAWKYTVNSPVPSIRVCPGDVDGLAGICVSDNGAGFDMNMPISCFSLSGDCTARMNFPALVSAWLRCNGSSGGMAVRFGRMLFPDRGLAFASR